MHSLNWIDLTGKTFGCWTVLSPLEDSGKKKKSKWLCKCACGREVAVSGSNLRYGKTKSCGCKMVKLSKERFTLHGYTANGAKSPEYRAYQNARQRCIDSRRREYKNYGGRGIKFLFKNFEDFITDIGDRPSARHSLDRIDNEGHYERGNVRWATLEEQCKNRRVKYLSEFSDEELIKEMHRRGLKDELRTEG